MLKNALLRVCKEENPVLTREIKDLYGKCGKLMEETASLVRNTKGMRGFEENEQKKRIAEVVKDASFAKFTEKDIENLQF